MSFCSFPTSRTMNRAFSNENLLILFACSWTICLSQMSTAVIQSQSPPTTIMLCENITEVDIYHFFELNAPPSHWIRPVKSFGKSVAVYMELSIRSILALDAVNQELFLTGFLYLSWMDEFRIWNTTSPLNCVDTVSLEFGANSKIWTPDICFFNSLVVDLFILILFYNK